MAEFFHGGCRGLRVGEYVLPPALTGTDHSLQKYSAEIPADLLAAAGKGPQRRDRVYLARRRREALAFAALYPSGDLYQVEPEGPVEPDPDNPEGAVQCPRARVVRVLERRTSRTFNWGFKQLSGITLEQYGRNLKLGRGGMRSAEDSRADRGTGAAKRAAADKADPG